MELPPGGPRAERRRSEDRLREGVGYHATSADGLDFQRVDDVRIEGRRRWLGNAQSDGRVITFFGTGEPAGWMTTSNNGQDWTLAISAACSRAFVAAVARREWTQKPRTPSPIRRACFFTIGW